MKALLLTTDLSRAIRIRDGQGSGADLARVRYAVWVPSRRRSIVRAIASCLSSPRLRARALQARGARRLRRGLAPRPFASSPMSRCTGRRMVTTSIQVFPGVRGRHGALHVGLQGGGTGHLVHADLWHGRRVRALVAIRASRSAGVVPGAHVAHGSLCGKFFVKELAFGQFNLPVGLLTVRRGDRRATGRRFRGRRRRRRRRVRQAVCPGAGPVAGSDVWLAIGRRRSRWSWRRGSPAGDVSMAGTAT